ncbi:MAG: YjbQ family protein [Elusimicrobia bacterium]|nr:YjbQ family protein [Elusimicrobiota bacterium]MBD3411744.1 YjbQ family protein [Elusimicrobiota bacterium]
MTVISKDLHFSTKGRCDIIDITDDVQETIAHMPVSDGIVLVFVIGSTAGITTVEYEPALVKDLNDLFEKLIPSSKTYAHDATWGDANGYSHLRASLLKSGEVFPFTKKKLILGTWQQIILIDFDNRSRKRHIVVQAIGE